MTNEYYDEELARAEAKAEAFIQKCQREKWFEENEKDPNEVVIELDGVAVIVAYSLFTICGFVLGMLVMWLWLL